MLQEGEDYSELKHSIVVFLCTFDFFEKNMPIYNFENVCTEDYTLKLEDRRSTIIVNTRATENVEKDLQTLFNYINNGEVSEEDDLVKEIHKSVAHYNQGNWRRLIMTLEDKMNERFREGEQAGLEQGENMLAQSLLKLLQSKGDLSSELEQKIRTVGSLDQLQEWFSIAIEAKTVGEFEEKIRSSGMMSL